MSDFIKEYFPGTPEYQKLKIAAQMLTTFSTKEIEFLVEDVYFDYGQDWIWTTIIAHDPKETGILHSWQALSPRQQEPIILANNPLELANAVNDFLINHN